MNRILRFWLAATLLLAAAAFLAAAGGATPPPPPPVAPNTGEDLPEIEHPDIGREMIVRAGRALPPA